MKFNFKTLSMFLAGAALTLTACSSEEPANNGGGLQQGEGIGYMAFSITTDLTRASRAGDAEFDGNADKTGDNIVVDNETFNNGETYEYAICPNAQANVAIFFDEAGNFYGASNLISFSNQDDADPDHNPDNTIHPTEYPEQFYTYVARWDNTNANPVPTQVLVLLNVNPKQLNKITEDAKQGLNNTLKLVGNNNIDNFGVYNFGGQDYFTMTNSSYVDGDVKNVVSIEGKVYATPEEALENRVTVYVERVLSKFEVTFTADAKTFKDKNYITFDPFAITEEGQSVPAQINYVKNYTGKEIENLDYPSYERKTWKVRVSNWGINAVEPESYYFKQIQNTNYFGDDLSKNPWYNTALHRSYWGETKNYSNNERTAFPTQYRSAKFDPNYEENGKYWGIDDNSLYNDEQTNGETALTYYSFNHFTKKARYKYAPARTYGSEATMGLENYGPYRFASHVLIGAQLLIDGVDTQDKVNDKYAAYNFYFGNEASYIRYAYRRMVTQFADGRAHTVAGNTYQTDGKDVILYAGGKMTPITAENAHDYFTTEVAQNIHGDGKVVIALKEGVKLYYKNAEGVATPLTANEIRFIVYAFTEAAKHFNEGRMYYAIPVQHKLGKTNGTMATINKDSGEYVVGQFGTVRNHWYTLNVKTIGSIGTSVDDPDQPIIPDPEDEYNIALEIVVLPWHKIDNGSVDL